MVSKALGSAPIEGKKLVRLAYLDEAGTGNINEEPILTVGGIIVNADGQLDAIEDEIARLTKKHVPVELREDFVFHAGDVFGGNAEFDEKRNPHWTDTRRLALFVDFVAVPKKIRLPVVTAHLDRRLFPQVSNPSEIKGDMTVLATTSAYIAALIEIDLWVRQFRKKEHCMVIFEDNVRSRQTMKDMHRHFQQKSIASLLAEEDLKYLPLRRIREDPTFQPKRPGHPLAIADMVAFVLKRHLMNDPWISCYFDLLIPQLAVMQLKDYKGSQQSYQS